MTACFVFVIEGVQVKVLWRTMNERLLLFIVEPPGIVELEESKEGERERKKEKEEI